MIPSLRPATAALPLLLAALLLPGPRAALRAADDEVEARRATAAELLKSMHLEQAVAAAGKRMLTNLDGMADRMGKQPNLTPDQTAEVQKFREEIHAIVEQQLGWDAIKTDVIQAYADDFSEPELKEMDTFYRTPTGQKLADKQPELSEKMTRVMQQKSMALAPSIRQKIQAVSAKVRPVPPVPPVPPVAPAPPAAPFKAPAASSTASPVTTVVIPAATPAATTATTAPVAVPTPTAPAATPSITPVSQTP